MEAVFKSLYEKRPSEQEPIKLLTRAEGRVNAAKLNKAFNVSGIFLSGGSSKD